MNMNSHNNLNHNFENNHFNYNGKKPNHNNLVKNSKMIGKKRKNIYSKNSENIPNGKRKKNINANKKYDVNDFQLNLFKFNNYLKFESMNFFYNNNSKYSTNKYIPSFSFKNFSK